MKQVAFDTNILSTMVDVRQTYSDVNNPEIAQALSTFTPHSLLDVAIVLSNISLTSVDKKITSQRDLEKGLMNGSIAPSSTVNQILGEEKARAITAKICEAMDKEDSWTCKLLKNFMLANDASKTTQFSIASCYLKMLEKGEIQAFVLPTVLREYFNGETQRSSINQQQNSGNRKHNQLANLVTKTPNLKIITIEETNKANYVRQCSNLVEKYYASNATFAQTKNADHNNRNDAIILAQSSLAGLNLVSFNIADYKMDNMDKDFLNVNKQNGLGNITAFCPNENNILPDYTQENAMKVWTK